MVKNVVKKFGKSILVFGIVFVLLFEFIPLSNVQADFSTGTEKWLEAFTESIQNDGTTKKQIDNLVTAFIANHFSGDESKEGAKQKDVSFSDVKLSMMHTAIDYMNSDGTYRAKRVAEATDTELLKALVTKLRDMIKNSENDVVKDMEKNYASLTDEEVKYYEGYLETLALEALYNYIKGDAYSRQILTDLGCVSGDKRDQTNGEKVVQAYSYGGSSVDGQGNGEGAVYLECNDTADILVQFRDKVQKKADSFEKDLKVLETTGKVSDKVKEKVSKIKENVEKGIEAGNKAATDSRQKPLSGFNWEEINYSTATDLGMEINHLLSRIAGKDTQKMDGFDGFTDVIKSLAAIVGIAGRYIMYALILLLGVRIIWNGVEGKTQFKEMLPFLLVGIIFFWAAPAIVNVGIELFKLDTSSANNYLQRIWGTIAEVVRVLAFAGIIFTGVKILFSNADKKAEVKSSLIAVLIGSIIVFAAATVVKISLDISKSAGLNSVNSESDLNSQIDNIVNQK